MASDDLMIIQAEIPVDLFEWLDRIAQSQGISSAALICALLEEARRQHMHGEMK